MSTLTLDDVRKVYRGKGGTAVEAVRGFDLQVDSGELVGLLGPSGCGKSTTLRMIAGLEDVTAGDILVDGASVTRLRPQERNIGVAFENYALYPPLTVAENIAFGLEARGISHAGQRQEQVEDIVERIGLGDIMHVRPVGLSSGQKQRVALARAIARRPDVLLLDEPLSHLDAAQRDTTRRELRRLQRELGYTTVLVTHDQEEALSLADRVVVMSEGAVQQVGTPDEIYDDPANQFVATFVGEPAMNLLSGLPGLEDAIVGVRPEDFTVVEPDASATTSGLRLEGTVVVYEELQELGLLTVEVLGLGERVVAMTPPRSVYDPGTRVGLRADPDRSYVFDSATRARRREVTW